MALPEENQQEVIDFVSGVAPELKSLRGLWAGQGISISEAAIAEARKEMWGNFPREQFFE